MKMSNQDVQAYDVVEANLTDPDVVPMRGATYSPEDELVTNRAGNIAKIQTLRDQATAEHRLAVKRISRDILHGYNELEELIGIDDRVTEGRVAVHEINSEY